MSSVFSFTPRPFQDVNSNNSNCLSDNNTNNSDGGGVIVNDSSDSELDEVSSGRHKRKQRRFEVVCFFFVKTFKAFELKNDCFEASVDFTCGCCPNICW